MLLVGSISFAQLVKTNPVQEKISYTFFYKCSDEFRSKAVRKAEVTQEYQCKSAIVVAGANSYKLRKDYSLNCPEGYLEVLAVLTPGKCLPEKEWTKLLVTTDLGSQTEVKNRAH